MMTDAELNAALAALPGERVTEEAIKARILSTDYFSQGTLTLCVITLNNGFQLTGESACVDPANFNQQIGESLAYKQAFNKAWPLFGFLLAEARFRRTQGKPTEPPGTIRHYLAAGFQRYRSHKYVWAAKIRAMEREREGGPWRVMVEGSESPLTVAPEIFARGRPDLDGVGAYLVVYEDGYVSWSPADKFEAGNARA